MKIAGLAPSFDGFMSPRPCSPGVAFCARCGASLPPAAAFCTGCGEPAAAPAPHAPAPASAPAARGARPVGVTLIGVATICVGGLIALAIPFVFALFAAGAGIAGAFGDGFFAALAGAFALFWIAVLLVVALLAGLAIATGVGVLRGAAWAYWAMIVLMALQALSGVGQLASQDFQGVLALAVAGLVIWYFLRPDVKRWFGRTDV